MALDFDIEAERAPDLPDPLAHRANDLAQRYQDARTSRDRRETKYRHKINHPTHHKVHESFMNRRILLYAPIALLVLPALLFLEWEVSRPIYEVRLPASPLIPFIVFSGLALVAGVLFGEFTSTFSLFSVSEGGVVEDRGKGVVDDLYGRRKRRWNPGKRAMCLAGGFFVSLLVEVPIYLFSQERVELLQQAGELTETVSRTDLWLPPLLYGLEILLGMPTFFAAVALVHLLSLRWHRSHLSRERDGELTLRSRAVETEFGYLHALDAYNRLAQQNGTRERFPIPPNAPLRRLLVEEFGYDPTHPDAQRPQEAGPPPGDAQPSPPREASPADHGRNGQNGSGADQRVDDLLNLMDQQISDNNRGL